MSTKQNIPQSLKEHVLNLQTQNGVLYCYIDGEPILDSNYEFDHVIPEAKGGETSISNIRVIRKIYNKRKGTYDLNTFKKILQLEKYAEEHSTINLEGLFDILNIKYKIPTLKLFSNNIEIDGRIFSTYYDDVFKASYFYAKLPVNIIKNDSSRGLQPRNLDIKRLLQLSEHLSTHGQLLPSIARLKDGELLLFDGQHKMSAQILNGKKEADLKVYIDGPDEDLFEKLMITNLEAHTKFKQTPFLNDVLFDKLDKLAKQYLNNFLDKYPEGTEQEFVSYLKNNEGFSSREATNLVNKMFVNSLYEYNRYDIIQGSKKRIWEFTPTMMLNVVIPAMSPPISSNKLSSSYRASQFNNFKRITEIWNLVSKESGITDGRLAKYATSRETYVFVLDCLNYIKQSKTQQERSEVLANTFSKEDFITFEKYMRTYFKHPLFSDNTPAARKLFSGNMSLTTYYAAHGLTLSWVINNTKL